MKIFVHKIGQMIHSRVIGDGSFVVKGVSSFDDADFHDITFACDPKYLSDLDRTGAGVVIVPDSFVQEPSFSSEKILLPVASPKVSFFKLVSIFHPEKKRNPGISSRADIGSHVRFGKDVIVESNVCIGDNVHIGDHVHLMPGVYIGDDVILGDHVLIKPNVTIMEKTRIGNRAIVHSGTVIGSDGFGFTREADRHEKIPHTGYVSMGDDVEIGAANTIDRGTLGITKIGNGVKTDNQVHIAHNVSIGDHTLIVAQVGIAGSARIGKHVIIAGKAGITGHIKIGDNAIVGPYAGVHADVGENEIVSGIPHMPHSRWRKVVGIIARLPEMRKTLFSFERRIKTLENKNNQTE